MARWWKEQFDPKNYRHANEMWGAGWAATDPGRDVPKSSDPVLDPLPVYFVYVCRFTFVFRSLDQLRACLGFYTDKLRTSHKVATGAADHWELQSWQQRLPLYLREETKRVKVVAALKSALEEFSK